MRMKANVKNTLFGIGMTILFFGALEMIFRAFVFPGSFDYIERRAIEQGLKQRKKVNEFRIFLYGESTMHGCHLYPYSTIDKWIKLYLADLLPEKISQRVTATNFGRIGEDSLFITQSFIDTVPYKPDLAVFYMAHNDFIWVENRKKYFSPMPFTKRFEKSLEELPRHSSFLNALNRLVVGSKIAKNRMRDSSLKKTDNWYESEDVKPAIAPSDLFYPNSPEFNIVMKGFEDNVKHAVDVAGKHSIPLVFLEGVSKWKGYEPVKSIHSSSIKESALIEWTGIFSEAEELFTGKKYNEALALYGRCMDIDPSYALTYYRIGECHECLGDYKEANTFYSLANDNDCFPNRAPSAVNRFYESLRAMNMGGVYVVQTQEVFEGQSPNGIIDERLIADQMHPAVEGQALIALEIVRVIYENDLLAPKREWGWDRLRTVAEMYKNLDLNNDSQFEICLGLASYLKRHYAKAAEYLEKALMLKPDSIFAKSWLAWAYWEIDEKQRALGLYKQLYQQAPAKAAKFFKKHPEIAATYF